MLWLYLHFPSLQLDTVFRDTSSGTQPLIIVHGKKNEVVQLNERAKQEGIQVGMGLGTAASLCHELQVKAYAQEVETRGLARIAHWLYPVTADIALFPPDGVLLRVTTMLTFHQSLASYWQTLSGHLAPLSLNYYYGTGYSPFAARILARQGLNQVTDDKAWLFRQLKAQSLQNSDLDPKDITRLHKVGVHAFSDLLRLSLPELSNRFSASIVNYLGRLTGQIQHSVNFYIPPSGFEHYLELYYEVSNHQYLKKPLLKLYTLLETYLRKKDQLAAELTLILHQRDTDDLMMAVTAAQGEYKADKWWQLTALSLESISLAAPVVGLTLKAKRLVNKYAQRTDLFQGSQGSLSADELVAMLTAKLGKEQVKGIQITEDARPEVANQYCAPLASSSESVSKSKLRPALLLPAPQPLREQISLMPYPERIVTGWWDEHPVVRDYFIGRSEQGRWLWLFRDAKQRWFVHGVFS